MIFFWYKIGFLCSRTEKTNKYGYERRFVVSIISWLTYHFRSIWVCDNKTLDTIKSLPDMIDPSLFLEECINSRFHV